MATFLIDICPKQGCGSRGWKRSYFNGSGNGSAKNMPLLLPHYLKKHTVNNVLDIIFSSIYYTLFYNARFAWMPDLTIGLFA